MTTVTINIPDSDKSILTDIANLVKKAGGDMFVSSDEKTELKEAFHHAFDMMEGKKPRRTIRDVLNG